MQFSLRVDVVILEGFPLERFDDLKKFLKKQPEFKGMPDGPIFFDASSNISKKDATFVFVKPKADGEAFKKRLLNYVASLKLKNFTTKFLAVVKFNRNLSKKEMTVLNRALGDYTVEFNDTENIFSIEASTQVTLKQIQGALQKALLQVSIV